MTPFVTTYRVIYADTDQMGIVYHANYLKYFEVSRSELMRAHGVTYREIEAQNIYLEVVHAELDYHRPAHYDDLIEIRTWVEKLGAASLTLTSQVCLDNQLLVSGKVKLASVSRITGKIAPLPEALRQAVKQYLAGEEE